LPGPGILQDVSFPVLDEVAQALKDNKGFRVQVEGHTSSEGSDDHNQTLSRNGGGGARLSRCAWNCQRAPTLNRFCLLRSVDSNATIAGRENNRRVEFVVHFTILNDGSK